MSSRVSSAPGTMRPLEKAHPTAINEPTSICQRERSKDCGPDGDFPHSWWEEVHLLEFPTELFPLKSAGRFACPKIWPQTPMIWITKPPSRSQWRRGKENLSPGDESFKWKWKRSELLEQWILMCLSQQLEVIKGKTLYPGLKPKGTAQRYQSLPLRQWPASSGAGWEAQRCSSKNIHSHGSFSPKKLLWPSLVCGPRENISPS